MASMQQASLPKNCVGLLASGDGHLEENAVGRWESSDSEGIVALEDGRQVPSGEQRRAAASEE